MKKIVCTLFICLIIQAVCAQEKRKNVVYTDVLGSALVGVGVGYERYFTISPRVNFTIRAGSALVDDFSHLSPHFGGSFLYGKRSALELGFNQLYRYDYDKLNDHDIKEFEGYFQPFIGYRYKNEKSGIMFRFFLVPPLGKFANWLGLPYPGLSLGYSF